MKQAEILVRPNKVWACIRVMRGYRYPAMVQGLLGGFYVPPGVRVLK